MRRHGKREKRWRGRFLEASLSRQEPDSVTTYMNSRQQMLLLTFALLVIVSVELPSARSEIVMDELELCFANRKKN